MVSIASPSAGWSWVPAAPVERTSYTGSRYKGQLIGCERSTSGNSARQSMWTRGLQPEKKCERGSEETLEGVGRGRAGALGCLTKPRVGVGDQIGYLRLRLAPDARDVNAGSEEIW